MLHKPIAFLSVLGLVAASTIIAASPASAIPITYTEQVTATGSLGGTPFSAPIVCNDAGVCVGGIILTMHNDTTNVTEVGADESQNRGALTVSVPGFPTATFIGGGAVVSANGAGDPSDGGFTAAYPVVLLDSTAFGVGCGGFGPPPPGSFAACAGEGADRHYNLRVDFFTDGFPRSFGDFIPGGGLLALRQPRGTSS
jgi:hypothetical protein